MERWEVCSNACHITIGYVALMTDREMQALLDILSHMLADWKRLAPEERPHNLIRCRKFRVKDPEEVGYEIYGDRVVAMVPRAKVVGRASHRVHISGQRLGLA